MTISINLKPETETRLRDQAASQGLDFTEYLAALVERAAADGEVDADMTREELDAMHAGIRRGLEAFEAGKSVSAEEVFARVRERHGFAAS